MRLFGLKERNLCFADVIPFDLPAGWDKAADGSALSLFVQVFTSHARTHAHTHTHTYTHARTHTHTFPCLSSRRAEPQMLRPHLTFSETLTASCVWATDL